MRQHLVAVLLLAVLAATTTACTKTAPPPGEVRARLDAGDRLEAAPPARAFAPVADGEVLGRGTRIRAIAGEPEIELPDDVRVALREGTTVVAHMPLFLDGGEILVASPRPVAISTALADMFTTGVVRVGQSLASSVRVYEGRASITSSGRNLVVGERRQTAIPALGLVAKRASPTTWRADDPWDAHHLRTVIALTDALEAQGRGFGRQAIDASATDVASLVPGLTAGALLRAARNHGAGDTLVGAAIAIAGSAPVDAVFDLRDAGAAWGIVAVERAAGDEYRAVDLVRTAIAAWLRIHTPGTAIASGGNAGADGSPAGSATVPSGSVAATPTTTTVPGTSGGEQPTTTTAPPVVLPPVTTPTLPPVTVPTVTTIVEAVEDTTDDVIGGLLGG